MTFEAASAEDSSNKGRRQISAEIIDGCSSRVVHSGGASRVTGRGEEVTGSAPIALV
jgi:hypothetical protein